MIYIYDSNLQKLSGDYPYTLQELQEKNIKITDICPNFKSDWWAVEKFFKNPKLVDGHLVEKTRLDLVLEGSEQLAEGEVIQDNEIITIPRPSEMFKPVWVVAEWVESATQEEIEEHEFQQSVTFYNSELEFASKATAELACEIIDQDTFESVKAYMRAIDPYGQPMRAFSEPQRPSIFDKYTK